MKQDIRNCDDGDGREMEDSHDATTIVEQSFGNAVTSTTGSTIVPVEADSTNGSTAMEVLVLPVEYSIVVAGFWRSGVILIVRLLRPRM